MSIEGLRKGAIISFVVSMALLIVGGFLSFDKVPPYPQKVVDRSSTLICDREAILRGQAVYQKYGLMDHRSAWGHGSLRGMDFSATTLHIMGEYMRDYEARSRYSKSFDSCSDDEKAMVSALVISAPLPCGSPWERSSPPSSRCPSFFS
jgi:nitric oxide reductase subunit B